MSSVVKDMGTATAEGRWETLAATGSGPARESGTTLYLSAHSVTPWEICENQLIELRNR
jgi:hypothetical protein